MGKWIRILLLGLSAFLALAYFRGAYWPGFFGGRLHSLARLHPVLVHFSLGFMLLLPLWDLFRLRSGQALAAQRSSLYGLGFLLYLLGFSSGIFCELVERYPNPSIQLHLLWACASGLAFVVSWLMLPRLVGRNSRIWSMALLLALLLMVVQLGHLGGLLHKGNQYFVWY